MSLSETQQAHAILTRAQHIVLIVPDKAPLDAIASMIALNLALAPTDNDQPPHIEQVSPTHVPANLQFLAGSSQIKTEPTLAPEVVIDLVGLTSISRVRTEPLSGGLRVHLTLPANTTITRQQLETTVRALPYDAIVTIGATDLEELGATFTNHADFFYQTPIINLDYRAANEHFGTVNLVDITASSCAEVTYDLISQLNKPLTGDIATALYAGVVAGTDSFQQPSTTPRSFQVAADLIEHDADRDAVIQNLVKTKPLKLIKLAGALYAHLRYEEQVKLYWTTLTLADFQSSHATADDIPAVMRELTNNIAGFTAAFLLYQDPAAAHEPPARRPQTNPYHVYLLLGRGLKPRQREIQSLLTATRRNGALTFTIPASSLEVAEKEAHEKVKQILP